RQRHPATRSPVLGRSEVMKMKGDIKLEFVKVFLRFALAASFLSSLTSRFGFWRPGMGWENYANFLDYTAKVNPFVPASLIQAIARTVDISEALFSILLIVGFRIRETAFLSGVMLVLFAVGMTIGIDILSPLDHSVFTAAAAAFWLVLEPESQWSLDALI